MYKAPNEIMGIIESSLNYSKQQLGRKNVTSEQKQAFGTIKDHFSYYIAKKVDQSFMIDMIAYHLGEAQKRSVNPKTVLSTFKQFDLNKIPTAQEECKVLTRLSDAVRA